MFGLSFARCAALSLVTCFGTGASASTLVDMFDVDSADINGADSSFSLVLGTLYEIKVSGTFVIGRNNRQSDAEWFDFDAPLDLAGNGIDIGLDVNGNSVDWGPYSPSHVYSISTDQLEGIVNFAVRDSAPGAYSDNVGFLSIMITDITPPPPPPSSIPLPAGFPLLAAGLGGLAWLRRRP